MSSLGFQLAMRMIEDHPSASVERFFMDTLEEGSLESGSSLGEFDAIAISASYEMDGPHVLDALLAAGLPLEARARGLAEESRAGAPPLVMMGGVLISVDRLPLLPFVDVFLHGDAEVLLPPLLDALSAGRPAAIRSSRERLLAIAGLPGVEITAGALEAAGLDVPESIAAGLRVPDGSDGEAADADGDADGDGGGAFALPRIEAPPRATLTDLEETPCATEILTPHAEFSDMALVDLARGCPHHCTFCWIGHNSPPYRARRIERIFEAIEARAGLTDRFGLVSSAVGAHEGIDEVCRWMMARGLRVSYSSLRVEEVTQTMLEALVKGGQRSITIAPEAGSTRVRRLLGKRISDERILDVVERAMGLGVENIKMYFMTGIPSETEEEAMEVAAFGLRVREIMLRWGRGRGRMGRLGFNLGIFVPKPNLPLNHVRPTPLAEVKRRLKKLVRALQRIPNSQVNVSSPELAASQAILSMGGVEASRYVRLVHERAGDHRAALREWRGGTEAVFARHAALSRLGGDELRRRASGAGAAS